MESDSSANPTYLSGRLAWHACTPDEVARADSWCDGSPGWNAWSDHLTGRKEPQPLEGFAGRVSPLAWALPGRLREAETAKMIAALQRFPKRNGRDLVTAQLRAWLAENEGAAAGERFGLECLAWCYALPRLAGVVAAEAWWELLDRLLHTAEDAAAIELGETPWAHQLLAGELPLVLAWSLPEIQPCRTLLTPARAQLSDGLEVLLNGEGLPHRRYLREFRALLACWTRCAEIGDVLPGGCWDRKAENEYAWAVRQALRLTRHDGGQVLCTEDEACWDASLFRATLETGGDEDDERIAELALPSGRGGSDGKLPEVAENSEWAELAILRPDWQRAGPILAVDYGTRQLDVELGCGPELLLNGPWLPRLAIDGHRAEPQADWECLCWESDSDMDYLELEIELTGGARLQRQMLLAREDLFLYVADAVLAKQPGGLDYRVAVPLAEGISFKGEAETREGALVGRRRRATVCPLALKEWKTDRRSGSFGPDAEGLQLHLQGQGRGLYAPLFFDLNPRRFKSQLTWRQLTVAEERQILPPGVAAAFRVQIGQEQWVIYRSLRGRASRTFLGLNVYNEFVLGRFDRGGEMEPLIEIE